MAILKLFALATTLLFSATATVLPNVTYDEFMLLASAMPSILARQNDNGLVGQPLPQATCANTNIQGDAMAIISSSCQPPNEPPVVGPAGQCSFRFMNSTTNTETVSVLPCDYAWEGTWDNRTSADCGDAMDSPYACPYAANDLSANAIGVCSVFMRTGVPDASKLEYLVARCSAEYD